MAPPVKKAHVTRHIDRMLFDEATRIMLGDIGDREAASSFVSEESAHALCDDIIEDRRDEIDKWLRSQGTSRLMLEKEFDKSDIARLRVPVSGIGFVTDPATRRIWMAKSSQVRIVLKRNPACPEGYELYTAFPMIDEDSADKLDIDPLPYFMASQVWVRSTPVKRAFLVISCDHGSKFPIWYDFNTDSIELRIAEGRQEFGFVFVNSDERPCWMIKDCQSLRMERKLQDIVMRRAFPSTCDRLDSVRGAIAAQRIQKDLEQTGMMEIDPFVPDRRISEILREAEGIIKAEETADKARQMRIVAAEEAERELNAKKAQREAAKEIARRKAQKRSQKASKKAKRRNEQERLRKRRAEEKARRKAEREAMKTNLPALQEASPRQEQQTDGQGHAGAGAPAAENPSADAVNRKGDSNAFLGKGTSSAERELRNAAIEEDNADNALVGYRIPQYDPETNDILVVWMGLDALVGGKNPRGQHSRVAGLMLHGDENDVHAAFARYRDLNSGISDEIARKRNEVISKRDGMNLTEVDDETGLPVVDESGCMLVDDRDIRPFDGGGYDLFRPEWLEFEDIGDHKIIVEVPFPQPLAHLVDEGRYDLVTFDAAMSLMGASNGWSPLISSDLLASIGIEYLMDSSESEPMLMDEAGHVFADPMQDASDDENDEQTETHQTGQRISRPKTSHRYSKTEGRILALPSFTTKEIPNAHYMTLQEKLAMRIAEERARECSSESQVTPEDTEEGQSAEDMSELDPRERLRRLMGGTANSLSALDAPFRVGKPVIDDSEKTVR